MSDFRSDEKHCRAVFTGGYARAAADALCGIHCLIGINLGDEDCIGIRRSASRNGNISAGLDDAVKGGAVYD